MSLVTLFPLPRINSTCPSQLLMCPFRRPHSNAAACKTLSPVSDHRHRIPPSRPAYASHQPRGLVWPRGAPEQQGLWDDATASSVRAQMALVNVIVLHQSWLRPSPCFPEPPADRRQRATATRRPAPAWTGRACLFHAMPGCGAQVTAGPTARGPEEDGDLITVMAQRGQSHPLMDDYLQYVTTQPPAKPLHLTQIFVLL